MKITKQKDQNITVRGKNFPGWLPIVLALVFSVVALVYTVFVAPAAKAVRIGFVNTLELLEKYKGLQEVNQGFDEKIKAWKANVDTLENEIARMADSYKSRESRLGAGEKEKLGRAIVEKRQFIEEYKAKLNEAASREENEKAGEISGIIRKSINEFGRKNGYDAIFGMTATGNILYGDEAIDVTAGVLEMMNANYLNEKKKQKPENR